jgi:hypothetical protein
LSAIEIESRLTAKIVKELRQVCKGHSLGVVPLSAIHHNKAIMTGLIVNLLPFLGLLTQRRIKLCHWLSAIQEHRPNVIHNLVSAFALRCLHINSSFV